MTGTRLARTTSTPKSEALEGLDELHAALVDGREITGLRRRQFVASVEWITERVDAIEELMRKRPTRKPSPVGLAGETGETRTEGEA